MCNSVVPLCHMHTHFSPSTPIRKHVPDWAGRKLLSEFVAYTQDVINRCSKDSKAWQNFPVQLRRRTCILHSGTVALRMVSSLCIHCILYVAYALRMLKCMTRLRAFSACTVHAMHACVAPMAGFSHNYHTENVATVMIGFDDFPTFQCKVKSAVTRVILHVLYCSRGIK